MRARSTAGLVGNQSTNITERFLVINADIGPTSNVAIWLKPAINNAKKSVVSSGHVQSAAHQNRK